MRFVSEDYPMRIVFDNKNLKLFLAVFMGYIGPVFSNDQIVDCRETELPMKYISLMAADKAPPIVAFGLMAITQGRGSGAYKDLEKLAKKDPRLAEVKKSVDQLTEAIDRQVTKASLYRQIRSTVMDEYAKKYGRDWQDPKGGIDLKQRARWEIAKRALNAGIKNSDYGQSRDFPTVSQEFEADTEKITNSAPAQIKAQMGKLAEFAEKYMKTQVNGTILSVGDNVISRRYAADPTDRLAMQTAREDFNRVVGQMTSEVSGKGTLKKNSSIGKGRVAGALGIVAAGSVDLASKAQAQEAVDSCKESWGVESKDVPLLTKYVVLETLPGGLGAWTHLLRYSN